MATKLRMYYNPYLCNVNLVILNEKDREECLESSVKDKIERYEERFCLEDDGDVLLDIILDVYRGSNICIEFVGTQDNFEYMEYLCKDRNIDIFQSEKQRILSVDEINKKIKAKVKELKEHEYDIDSNGEIDKIFDTTIPVVVVGSMSAGKSSFINALVGEELLPSGQNRTTGVNCALHNLNTGIKVEFLVSSKHISIDCVNFDFDYVKEHVSPELAGLVIEEQKPIDRARKIIEYYNYKNEDEGITRTELIDGRFLDVYCPFYNSDIPEQIVFYDTPGSDSDTFGDDLLTLKQALKEQTKGFVIFVCSQRAELDKAQDLINIVKEATEGKMDIPHTIVICNKTEIKPDCSGNTSTEKEWGKRIIYVSSAVALGARKRTSSDDEWKEEHLLAEFVKNERGFSDPDYRFYVSLPQFCSLPNSRRIGLEDEHERIKKELIISSGQDKSKSQLIQFNSGISIAENEIIFVARELFPYNQCERARNVFLNLLSEYRTSIEEIEVEKEEHRKRRVKEFDDLYKSLCEDLSNFTKEYIPTAQQNCKKDVIDSASWRRTKEKSDKFADDIKAKLLGKDIYAVHSEEYIKGKILEVIEAEFEEHLKIAQSDFDSYLKKTVLEDYSRQCKEIVYKQASLSEKEKEVFGNFFSGKELVDKTSSNRKGTVENVSLKLPQLADKVLGEKWYSALFKSLVNIGKTVGYWAEKSFNLGGVTEELTLLYDRTHRDFTADIVGQTREYIEEIMDDIMKAFRDVSSGNNIICEMNPQLKDIKRLIDKLNKEIEELETKKKRIEGELVELNEVYSSVN